MTATEQRAPGILMVTGAYFPELSGGGLQCKATINALRGRLRFMVLTTSTDPSLRADDEVEGTPVHRAYVDVTSRWSRICAGWTFVRTLVGRRRSFDVVHLHGFSQKSTLVILLAKLLRKTTVLTLHTAGHDEPAAVRSAGRLAYWAYSSVDAFIAVSAPLADHVERAGVPASRVWCVSNGVDLGRFRPAVEGQQRMRRRELSVPETATLILFVGFFSEDKGPQILFDAWKRIATTSGAGTMVVYVGATNSRYYEVDPALAPAIREAAARDGLSGRLVFAEETRIIEQYYQAADLFVFPSRREAFGMALIEAMATGLPCIASNIPGVTDQIVKDEETGLLVPPHDAPALAAALGRLLSDRVLAARLGAAARQDVARRFDIDRTAMQTLDVYHRVLAQREPEVASA